MGEDLFSRDPNQCVPSKTPRRRSRTTYRLMLAESSSGSLIDAPLAAGMMVGPGLTPGPTGGPGWNPGWGMTSEPAASEAAGASDGALLESAAARTAATSAAEALTSTAGEVRVVEGVGTAGAAT